MIIKEKIDMQLEYSRKEGKRRLWMMETRKVRTRYKQEMEIIIE